MVCEKVNRGVVLDSEHKKRFVIRDPESLNSIPCWVAVWQTFVTRFWLNAGDWKLVHCPFMVLLK